MPAAEVRQIYESETLEASLKGHAAELSRWLMDSSGVFALLLAPDGAILDRNRAAHRLFSHDSQTLLGQSIWDYIKNPEGESVRDRLRNPSAGGDGCVLLNLIDEETNPVTLEAQLVRCGGTILLLAIHEFRHDSLLNNEALRLTNELSVMVREGARKNRELEKANETIRELARSDALTGLANRRTLHEVLQREVARADRKGEHLSVIMADLDHFKSVNDHYGHSTGDQVLVLVAAVLENGLRPFDLAARYGGEEFILLLPAATVAQAWAVAERKRREVGGINIPGRPDRITVSMGVAGWIEGETAEAFVARADAALYHAKRSGRNRIETAGDGAAALRAQECETLS